MLRALAEAAADRPGDLCVATHGLICRTYLAPFALCEGDALCKDFPAAGRLEVAYPCAGGTPPAFTRLGWHADGERLRVETVHTYPEEGRGVRTRTEFSLPSASKNPIPPLLNKESGMGQGWARRLEWGARRRLEWG
jgi:hypothetical protein